MDRFLVLCMVVACGALIAASTPKTLTLPTAERITYTIETSDSTDFLGRTRGCATAVAHYEQGGSGQVTVYGCPEEDSAQGQCVSLAVFTSTTLAPVVFKNAHPWFRVKIDTQESGSDSVLTLSCSNAQI